MINRRSCRAAALALAATGALASAGAAAAAPADDWPTHEGNPWGWGPPLEQLCSDPAAAAALGYNVIIGGALADVINGTVLPDAIYALGGNDTVRGGPRDDLICLGSGNDRGRGNAGNDGIFGETGNDKLVGDGGTDFCNGGPGVDTAATCEAVMLVP